MQGRAGSRKVSGEPLEARGDSRPRYMVATRLRQLADRGQNSAYLRRIMNKRPLKGRLSYFGHYCYNAQVKPEL